MSFTLTSSGTAIIKAGRGASTTVTMSGTVLNALSDEVEGFISAALRADVITNYGNFTAQGKKILDALASSMIAQSIIAYDPSGYTNIRAAETLLDKLENDIDRCLGRLSDDKVKTYLKVT